jgi:hypothetical protein
MKATSRVTEIALQPRFIRPGFGEPKAYGLGDILDLLAAEIRRLVEAGIVY